MDIVFDAHGAPANLTAAAPPQGRAQLTMLDKHSGPRGLQRGMQADRIVAVFAPSAQRPGARATAHLVQVLAQGNASARGESPYTPARPSPLKQTAAQFKTTTIHGDDLQLGFSNTADSQTEPKHLHATGHTLLQQDAPLAEQETSSGDILDADFAQQSAHGRQELTLTSAVQTGHVVVHRTAAENPAKPTVAQQVATATADRTTYDGLTQKLTLIGGTHLAQDNAVLTATTVVLDQRTQDSDAFGDVQATLQSAASGQRPAQFTHVFSSSAHFTHESRQAEFQGTDAKPARMWQDASQVQAAVLVLDDVHRTCSARPDAAGVQIHAVFTGASTPKPGSDATVHGNVVRVTAAKMDYSDMLREASFTGAQGVVIEGSGGTIHAGRAVAYLHKAEAKTVASAEPSPFSSSLDHIVVTGDVQIDQPGRHGTGEQLVYTAATGQSVLTGTPARPPHIVDAQQGSITGVTLAVGDAGSTIVVTGSPQQPGAKPNETKPVRVHTETHLQPGTAERQ